MKRKIASLLSLVLVLCACMNAMAASYSSKWSVGADGNWRLSGNSGLLRNTWVLDDECDVPGGVYYLVDDNGNLVSDQLVLDGEGHYYSFNDQHDGHFGAMRTVNGTYQGVSLTFSAVHDGSFGSITNANGIAALAKKFKVREMPAIKNSAFVKLSEIRTNSGGSYRGGGSYTRYTVQFIVNLSTGSASPSSYEAQTVRTGGKLVKPATPSDLSGKKIFKGWTITQDGYDYWNFDNDIVTKNFSLFAKWADAVEAPLTRSSDSESVLPPSVAEAGPLQQRALPTSRLFLLPARKFALNIK